MNIKHSQHDTIQIVVLCDWFDFQISSDVDPRTCVPETRNQIEANAN